MIDVLGLLAYLSLPLIGSAVWRLDGVRRLPIEGRLAIAAGTGAFVTALLMSVMALAGVSWSRTRLLVVLVLVIVGSLWNAPLRSGERSKSWRSPAMLGIVLLLALMGYGLLTARQTTGDLLFFWGPKAVHFYRAGTIDVDYLRDPNSFLTHRDYPPLLPLVYAWSHTLSRQFSWWAAVLFSGLCLAAIALLIRASSRDDLIALLTVALLGWGFTRAQVAGGADPLLLLFEAMAVAALLFIRDARSQTIVAAIGVAGAMMTKVEGASFAIAILVAMLVDRRPLKRIAAVILPSVVLLAGWLAFLVRNDLLDTYRGPGPLSFRYVREVFATTFISAGYDMYWLPWIAPLLLLVLGNARRTILPLTVAALSIAATLNYYLRSPIDPSLFWIPTSVHRVLLTPMLMLLLGAAAAHTMPSPLDESKGEG